MGECRKRRTKAISRIVVCVASMVATYVAQSLAGPVLASVQISSVDATGRVALGDSHTCAIANDNTMWCWGDNTFGQLGNGAGMMAVSDSPVPIRVTALGGARTPSQIVAGSTHSCVLATDGTVWCWGGNGLGQLGSASGDSAYPTRVTLAGAASLIAAGGLSTCAVLVDNSVQCWGKNTYGQLGLGTTTPSESTPQTVLHIPEWFTVHQLDVGANHTCAMSTTGVAWCWGYFQDGRLGLTQQSNVVVPAATASLGGTGQSIATGGAHTCVVLTGGSVTCFGKNNNGQIGQSLSTTFSATPNAVTLPGSASGVATGNDFTCATLVSGGVSCFGANGFGQIGTGSTSTRELIANLVVGITGSIEEVVTGLNHSCAVKSTGQLLCWGNNDFGKTGSNTGNLVETSAVAVGSLNVVPTTTTTTTTTTTSSSTSTSSITTTPAVVSPPVSIDAVSTSSTPSTTLVAKPNVKSLVMKRGTKVSAAKLASAVSMAIPKTSQGSMRIVIVSGVTRCVFRGNAIAAVQKGKCTISVTLLPKQGKSVTRRTSITVR